MHRLRHSRLLWSVLSSTFGEGERRTSHNIIRQVFFTFFFFTITNTYSFLFYLILSWHNHVIIDRRLSPLEYASGITNHVTGFNLTTLKRSFRNVIRRSIRIKHTYFQITKKSAHGFFLFNRVGIVSQQPFWIAQLYYILLLLLLLFFLSQVQKMCVWKNVVRQCINGY